MLGKNLKNVHTLQGCKNLYPKSLSRDSEIYGRAFAETAKHGKYRERPPRQDSTLHDICIEWGLSLTDGMGEMQVILFMWEINAPTTTCACRFSRLQRLLQARPTLCDLTDCSPPGSFVLGILQARILEWVAIHFSDLPDPGIEPRTLKCLALAGGFFIPVQALNII